MNGKGNNGLNRRNFLRATAATLPLSIAGCTTDTPQESTPRTPDPAQRRRRRIPPAIWFQSQPAPEIAGSPDEYNYQDLPIRDTKDRATIDIMLQATNKGNPDSRNVEMNIEGDRLELTLNRVRIDRPLDLQIWRRVHTEEELIEELTLEPTETYTDVTYEITDLPPHETHIENVYGAVIVDEDAIGDTPPQYDPSLGRVLKVTKVYEIPYDGPNGRTTKIFKGEQVNREYIGYDVVEDLNLEYGTYVEDLENNHKAIFVFVYRPDLVTQDWEAGRGSYGIAMTLPQETFEEENIAPRAGTNIMLYIKDIETTDHYQTLADELATANEKLDLWTTFEDKIRAIAYLVAQLEYEAYTQEYRTAYQHPTRSLGSPDVGSQCTEKAFIFSALVQTALGLSGDDAAYVQCNFRGVPHYVMGINVTKFDDPDSSWDRYNFAEDRIENGAPADADYIPTDPTAGSVGNLTPEFYSDIDVFENLDCEYAFVL